MWDLPTIEMEGSDSEHLEMDSQERAPQSNTDSSEEEGKLVLTSEDIGCRKWVNAYRFLVGYLLKLLK